MENIEYIPATELKLGDILVEADGSLLPVTEIGKSGRYIFGSCDTKNISRVVKFKVLASKKVRVLQ